MHYYVCPYCNPHGRLTVIKTEEAQCDHKKGFLFNKDKECQEDNYKCKEVLVCNQCENYFKISDDFLAEQKRKIKDG